jgi:hypothetical protein
MLDHFESRPIPYANLYNSGKMWGSKIWGSIPFYSIKFFSIHFNSFCQCPSVISRSILLIDKEALPLVVMLQNLIINKVGKSAKPLIQQAIIQDPVFCS